MKNIPKDFEMRKNPKAHRFVIKQVSTAELRNIKGQRLPKVTKVNKIIDNFDPNLVNIVKVSDRGGVKRIIDGDNTCIACKKVNGDKDCMMWCKVFLDMNEQDELYYFILQNGFEDDPTFNENLYALYTDNNKAVLRYVEILERYGMKVDFRSRNTDEFKPSCHKTLYNAFLADEIAFEDTIRILSRSYAKSKEGLRNELCSAIFKFVFTYRDVENYSERTLIKKLNYKSNDPKSVFDKAKARIGNSKYKFAREILVRYNSGFSEGDKLPDIFKA